MLIVINDISFATTLSIYVVKLYIFLHYTYSPLLSYHFLSIILFKEPNGRVKENMSYMSLLYTNTCDHNGSNKVF